MRKLLLACVATVGSGMTANVATAQPAGAPTQGQVAWPITSQSVASVNDNNNSQAQAIAGAFAVPAPGTIVVHINGRVNVGYAAAWSSAGTRFFTAPTGFAAEMGINGTGGVKLAPNDVFSYARLYFGADAMASNGLRYGAAIELRQNFTGQVSNNTSDGASGYSSAAETIFVRRAFTYVAGENWGNLRMGQADGVIGLFDNGVTTLQYLPTGNLQNGSDLGALVPTGGVVPFFFLSLEGNEYAYAKLVYLSPQIAGFDFGIQYAPNTSNGFAGFSNYALAGGIMGSGIGTGLSCTAATTGCATLSSGPGIQDGARVLNHTVLGARYQNVLGGIGVLAYAAYGISGHADYTGATTAVVLGNAGVPTSKFTGQYDGLNYGNGGIALAYGGFSVGANIIGGRINGVLAPAPRNGASEIAVLLGAKYVSGPFSIGVAVDRGYYQGNVNLSGISQRRGQGLDVGASYAVAPGYLVYAEYQYQNVHQSDFNFLTSAVGSGANNDIHSQIFVLANVVNF